MIRFRVEEESGTRTLDIDLDDLTVGRAPGCSVALKDPAVGRFHASLQRDGTILRLVVSGRGGGTWVNGRPVTDTAELRVGDRLTVGKTHLVLGSILPGRPRIPPPSAPDPPVEAPGPPATASDSALLPAPGSDAGGGLLGMLRRAVTPSAPPPPATPPAAPPPPPPRPVEESGVGFSTEVLRAPGSSGEEEARALRRILEINTRLARERDEPRLLERILRAAADLTGASRGILLLRTADGEPAVRAALGGAETDAEAWAAAARRVLRTGRTIRIEGEGGTGGRPMLSVPLRGDGDPVGVLCLDREAGQPPFPARAAVLLEAFADQAAVALLTARLLAENRERAGALERAGADLARANAALEESLRRRTSELEDAREEAARARGAMGLKFSYDRIVGRSAAMRTLLSLVDKVTDSVVPVLIEGESGTGKELVARAIHRNGPRGERPFVVENCAAVPDPLIENELFGHERGAFTGADRAQDGLFERADGGTLFLDEVGDMSPEMQKKLLRVLQEGEVRRVGGKTVRRVDVRVLSATNRDLARLVKEGKFREDLFYRLCVVRVRIPPLRERPEDVPILAAHFLDRIAAESGGKAPRMEADALDALVGHRWPGNVRQLENEIRRAATLAEGSISPEVLSPEVRSPAAEAPVAAGPGTAAAGEGTLKDAVEALERRAVLEALRRLEGNKTRAAAALGLSRLGLRKKMARYGIEG